ncbi:MAG: hypothetical protein K2R98_25385 [Gemmataceae bacterium]|nr:hypothetical protein [Gemmataceae bacterium]
MRRNWMCFVLAPCVATVLFAGKASAWDWFCRKTAEIPMGKTTEADHTLDRAGHPEQTVCYAHATNDCAYIGYPVGGGAACKHKGDYPAPTDGTWGWDYQGRCFKRHVFLYYWHGRRYQDGGGAYKIDGPEILKKKECD